MRNKCLLVLYNFVGYRLRWWRSVVVVASAGFLALKGYPRQALDEEKLRLEATATIHIAALTPAS